MGEAYLVVKEVKLVCVGGVMVVSANPFSHLNFPVHISIRLDQQLECGKVVVLRCDVHGCIASLRRGTCMIGIKW